MAPRDNRNRSVANGGGVDNDHDDGDDAATYQSLLPVGIDVGSLHARMAAGTVVNVAPSSSSSSSLAATDSGLAGSLSSLPEVVRNSQGARHTLAASAAEFHRSDHHGDGGDGDGWGAVSAGEHGNSAAADAAAAAATENGGSARGQNQGQNFVFGEAARQSLGRARAPLERSLVRHLSSLGASPSDDEDNDESKADADADADADLDLDLDADVQAEADSQAEAARLASSAFFAHLAHLVRDARSVRPSDVRVVLNAPPGPIGDGGLWTRSARGAVEAAERGMRDAADEDEKARETAASAASGTGAAGEKKRKKEKKKRHKDDKTDGIEPYVIGVLSDPAAVAVAHGLGSAPFAPTCAATPVSWNDAGTKQAVANRNKRTIDWSDALIVDWGASSLTLSHLRNVGNTGMFRLVRTMSEESCSGSVLLSTLVGHCASQFERRHRLPPGTVVESKKARGRLERSCEDALRTLGGGGTSSSVSFSSSSLSSSSLGTGAASATVVVDGLYDGLDLNVAVSRPRFDMLCGPLFRTAKNVLEAQKKLLADEWNDMEEEGNSKPRVFDVVLAAGNVSLMPGAAAVIDSIFPSSLSSSSSSSSSSSVSGLGCWRGRSDVPPDEAVAIGCAMHCEHLLRFRASAGTFPPPRATTTEPSAAPMTESIVPLCPVSVGVCRLGSKSDDAIATEKREVLVLVQEGEPLPAYVVRTIALGDDVGGGGEGGGGMGIDTPCLGVVQLLSDENESDSKTTTTRETKLLARIEGLSSSSSSSSSSNEKVDAVELAVEITVDGRLVLAVNGEEPMMI